MASLTRNVVFLHTAGTQPDSWAGVLNALPADITPWLPNLSTGGPAEQLTVLEKLLDRNELRDVALVAFGSGAPVAVLFAARQPHRVNALLLASPLLHADPAQTKALARAVKWVPGFLLRRRGLDKQTILADLAAGPVTELAGDLAAVSAPTVLLSTAEETVAEQIERTAAQLPEAQVRVVAGVAGNWYEDDPARFSSEVLRFLAGAGE